MHPPQMLYAYWPTRKKIEYARQDIQELSYNTHSYEYSTTYEITTKLYDKIDSTFRFIEIMEILLIFYSNYS